MQNKKTVFKVLIPIVSMIFLLALWQFVSQWLNIRDYILPKPTQIVRWLISSPNEWTYNYIETLQEAAAGMLLGSLFGFGIGVALAESKYFRWAGLPFIIASNAIPVVAIAPIIIIWFGNSILSKIAVASFISFFPVVLNTFKGLSEYNPNYKELFQVYGATSFEFLFKYKIGNAATYITTGLKLNATLSVIGAIVGELVSSDRGLGFGILQANYNFNSSKLWAYIFLTCSIGIAFYLIIALIENTFLKEFQQA